MAIGILLRPTAWYPGVKQHRLWFVLGWVTVLISMSISADSPSDETLNRGPLALLLRRQYEFLLGINIVKFSIFFISVFLFQLHRLVLLSSGRDDSY